MSEKPTESSLFERTVSRRELLEKAGKVGAGAVVAGRARRPGRGGDEKERQRRKTVPTGGTVIWALEQDPGDIARSAASSRSNHTANELMYDSLLEWDPKLNIKPALAESYDVVNSKRIVWTLRKGVKFHNGQEFTAADAKYSFDQQPEPAAAGQRGDDRPGPGDRRRRRCSRSTSSGWT